MDLTIEEWLHELEKATAAGSDGMTAGEIAEKVGHAVQWVRSRILQPAQKQGRLIVGKGVRTSINGMTVNVPVYRLASVGKGKKK